MVSLIYGFWLPLWYLWFTASDYLFGISKLFLHLIILIETFACYILNTKSYWRSVYYKYINICTNKISITIEGSFYQGEHFLIVHCWLPVRFSLTFISDVACRYCKSSISFILSVKLARGDSLRKGDNFRWKKIKHLKPSCGIWRRRCIRVWHIITFSWSLMSHMIFPKLHQVFGYITLWYKSFKSAWAKRISSDIMKTHKSPEHFWSVYIFYIEVVNSFYPLVYMI